MDKINQVGIGNIRDRSLGAWRFARLSHSVCAESMCFEIPGDDDRCRSHRAKAAQPKKELQE